MKRTVLLMTFVLTVIFSYGQPKIQFDKIIHDFGNIKEMDGRVTGRFEFSNVGDSTLTLVSVKPGCGCTAANYTKTAVAPGERGFIDATYDPRNRPNGFSKGITVTTNEPTNNTTRLTIKGFVEKRPPTIYESTGYTNGKGMVRIKNSSFKMEMKNSEVHLDTLLVRNFWNKNVLVDFIDLPAHITEVYRSFGNEIKPDEEGFIVIQYDAGKKNDFGMINETVVMRTNDSLEANKTIYYTTQIREDFSKMSERALKKAPVIGVEPTTINFGDMAKNSTATQSVKITNTGRTPLIIRSVQSVTNVITPSFKTTTIAPNSSTVLDITIKAQGRGGKQVGTIDIICNDPKNDMPAIKYEANFLK